MDKFERLYTLHRIFLNHRKPVSLSTIAEKLECTERNARRLLDFLRDRVKAPLEQDKDLKGWYYTNNDDFELPGIWLNGNELHSLSLLLDILNQFGSSELSKDLEPVKKTIIKMLEARGINPEKFTAHIKVIPIGYRQVLGKTFNKISEAVLNNKRLCISYKSYTNRITKRDISPQNLIYYRENWYLDAWCHLRKALRTFSISRIQSLDILQEQVDRVDQLSLEKHYARSYGIFSGEGKHTAKLRFSAQVAREIAIQQWHPDQISEWDGDDYILSFPYSSDKELLQDLLRHTPNVYVESPAKLRKALQIKLQAGLERCIGKGLGWL